MHKFTQLFTNSKTFEKSNEMEDFNILKARLKKWVKGLQFYNLEVKISGYCPDKKFKKFY